MYVACVCLMLLVRQMVYIYMFVCLFGEGARARSIVAEASGMAQKQLRELLLRRQGTWQDRITLHFWVQPPFPRGTSKPGTDGYIANYPLEQRMTISPGAEDSLGVETRGVSTHATLE